MDCTSHQIHPKIFGTPVGPVRRDRSPTGDVCPPRAVPLVTVRSHRPPVLRFRLTPVEPDLVPLCPPEGLRGPVDRPDDVVVQSPLLSVHVPVVEHRGLSEPTRQERHHRVLEGPLLPLLP